jgi:hypothetical protein
MTKRLVRRALISVPIALAFLAVAPASPASADVCAQVGVSTDGNRPAPIGPCDPFQPWPFPVTRCDGGTLTWGNIVVTHDVCAPTPL